MKLSISQYSQLCLYEKGRVLVSWKFRPTARQQMDEQTGGIVSKGPRKTGKTTFNDDEPSGRYGCEKPRIEKKSKVAADWLCQPY